MNLKIDDHTLLTPIGLDDAQQVYENFSSDIIEFLPISSPPDKIEDTIEFIKLCIDQWQNKTDMVWIILDGNEFSGCCGIHTLQSKQPHFGIWIKKPKQGKGIGKKVVHFMLNWGVENLNVDFIKYPVDKRNTKSIGIIEAMGLRPFRYYKMGDDKILSVIEYRYHKK